MNPYIQLDKTSLADGSLLALYEQDGEFVLEYNGLELMSTNFTCSEQMLADLGCVDLLEGTATRPEHPRVLIAPPQTRPDRRPDKKSLNKQIPINNAARF
ncbi:hypothetical protein OAK81_00315 [Verrucomicrobiales bacterium]|nr:hypothetical protein [Verrucomicrobiales bacterium]